MLKKFLSLVLILALFISLIPLVDVVDAEARPNVAYQEQRSLQPLGHEFHFDTLLNWTPEMDPDARYNRSYSTIAERRAGWQVNPNAHPDFMVSNCADSHPLGRMNNVSYGIEGTWRRYAFTFWQYLDVYTYWGGPFIVPTPEMVHTAHANGVPVIGTVFFSNNSDGTRDQRRFMTQLEDGTYPYIDKLWEIAEFYGFDGWFINAEGNNGITQPGMVQPDPLAGPADFRRMREAMAYMQDTKPEGGVVIWYDAMATGGVASFQNQLNANNRDFLQWVGNRVDIATGEPLLDEDGNTIPVNARTSDFFMPNYWWTGNSNVDNSVAQANLIGRSPFDLHFGLEVHMNSYMHGTMRGVGARGRLRGENDNETATSGRPVTSVNLFGVHSTINASNSASDFLNFHENKFWTGSNQDPNVDPRPMFTGDPAADRRGFNNPPGTPNNNANAQWTGISQFAVDKTAILGLPFNTFFNPGMGESYFIDGIPVKSAWANRSIADIMPTWRWTVLQSGGAARLQPYFDFSDAFYGGTSLRLTGDLVAGGANEVRLYSTFLDFTASGNYELTYTLKANSNVPDVEIGFYTAPDYASDSLVFPAGGSSRTVNGWTQIRTSLDELRDTTVYGIAIRVQNATDETVNDYQVNIGQISIDNAVKQPALPTPTGLTLDGYMINDSDNSEARIFWDKVEADNFSHYQIYQVFADGSRQFINRMGTPAFYISNLRRDPNSPNVVLEVSAVNQSLVAGAPAVLSFDFGIGEGDTKEADVPVPFNLAANRTYWASRANFAEPASAAFDGQFNTKWCADGAAQASVSIDMGYDVTVSRLVVHHAGPFENADAPPNSPQRIFNTHDFGLYVSDYPHTNTADWTEVWRTTNNFMCVTDVNFEEHTGRYWRLHVYRPGQPGSSWQATRIFGIELYEHPLLAPSTEALPMQFASVLRSADGDTAVFRNVPEGTTVFVYDSIDAEGSLANAVSDSSGIVEISELDLGEVAGRLFYDLHVPDGFLSARMSVPFEAVDAIPTMIPEFAMNFDRFGIDHNFVSFGTAADIRFGAIEAFLPEGGVLSLYNGPDDVFPFKRSAPVVHNGTSTTIEALSLSFEASYVWASVKVPGMAPSEKFQIFYTADGEVDNVAMAAYYLRGALAKADALYPDLDYITASPAIHNAFNTARAVYDINATERTALEAQLAAYIALKDAFVAIEALTTARLTAARPADLIGLLDTNDRVYVNVPGNLGIFTQHSPFTVPADTILVVENVLNIHGRINVEGTLIVLEGGRINNMRTGIIYVAEGGKLINDGYIENQTGSSVLNSGTITNNDRFEIRAGATLCKRDGSEVDGAIPLRIHRDAIRLCELCTPPPPDNGGGDEENED